MSKNGCREQDELIRNLIVTSCRVREAEQKLEVGKGNGVAAQKCLAVLRAAKDEERLVLAALDTHQKEHGCKS
jgi:hypothetical protein